MSALRANRVIEVLTRQEDELVRAWLQELRSSGAWRPDMVPESEVEAQARELIMLLRIPLQHGSDVLDSSWTDVREFLTRFSRAQALQGLTPSETASFVLALKQPVFARLQQGVEDAAELAENVRGANALIDALALQTIEAFQRTREEVIRRQQQEIMELSTPVVKLWEGIVAVPVIGTLDSARTQVVMQNLLERIVETGALIAIIDITGVPTVDTLVAQHLIKTVAAARLMGAECIISGIRPQIAQTIVHLGIELEDVSTKASLADAIALAFRRLGLAIHRA